jgi:hypothetical protein
MRLSNTTSKGISAELSQYLTAINDATDAMLTGVMASIGQDIESESACNGQDKHPKVSNTGVGSTIATVIAFNKPALKEKLGAR